MTPYIDVRTCACCRTADGTATAWVAGVGLSEVEDECPLLALARACAVERERIKERGDGERNGN